jgi:tRNA pseudouridine55 synthase
MYSALKREGVPLYKLARRGIEVPREPRDIEIRRLVLTLAAPDRLEFAVECSKGTYVRVLAADIGAALGTVAHLEQLRRTRVGRFSLAAATTLDALLAAGEAPLPVVGVREALAHYDAFPAPTETLVRLRHGQQEPLARLPPPREESGVALVLDPSGGVAAVIEAAGGRWRLARLLAVS